MANLKNLNSKPFKVEAEGSELVLKNKAGDYVIIPKKYRLEVKGMIKDGCFECIDALVETLPVREDYAKDGTIVSELWKQKTGKDWNQAKKEGLTDGSYEGNIILRQKLLSNKPYESLKSDTEHTAFSPEADNFNDAFKIARQKLGSDEVFKYKDKLYVTNLSSEPKKQTTPEVQKPIVKNIVSPEVKPTQPIVPPVIKQETKPVHKQQELPSNLPEVKIIGKKQVYPGNINAKPIDNSIITKQDNQSLKSTIKNVVGKTIAIADKSVDIQKKELQPIPPTKKWTPANTSDVLKPKPFGPSDIIVGKQQEKIEIVNKKQEILNNELKKQVNDIPVEANSDNPGKLSEMFEFIKNGTGNLGKIVYNYVTDAREKNTTVSTSKSGAIKMPEIKNESNLFDNPLTLLSDTIKTNERIYTPVSVDLNKAVMISRNRGDEKDIQNTLGSFVSTMYPFVSPKEYLSQKQLNRPSGPSKNDNVLVLDKDGKMTVNKYTSVKDANAKVSFISDPIQISSLHVGKVKSYSSNLKQFELGATLEDGKTRPIPIGTGKDDKGTAIGGISGGKILLTDKNNENPEVVYGRGVDLVYGVELYKEKHNLPSVQMYILDNGTFSNSVQNKQRSVSKTELKNRDNQNTSGNNLLFINDENAKRKIKIQNVIYKQPIEKSDNTYIENKLTPKDNGLL